MSTAPNLLNATPHEVTYLDGKTETINLGRLSIRNLYTWTHHLAGDRIPEMVARSTGKPLEWLDNLTDESFAALSAKCIQLNFPRAMVLGETDPTIAIKLAPLLHQLVGVIKASPSPGPISSASSAEPAPSASPAEIGSASSTSPLSASSPSSPSTVG